jgi:phosphatidylethanolamine-binding protein (PEBP) family uncharacterized protein
MSDIPEVDDETRHGRNSEAWLRCTGLCPPFTQRYFFTLYVLDTFLELEAGASSEELIQTMQGHIMAQGEHIGRYKRQ